MTSEKYKLFTRKDQCRANELFAIGRVENNEYCFLLSLLIVQRKQQKEPKNINTKLSTYISYRGSGYSRQSLDNVKIICYDSKIYVPQSLCRHVLDWYYLYFNHPGGSRLAKTTRGGMLLERPCHASVAVF